MADKPVGKITHYYDKIKVAVVKLGAKLKTGDTIKITGHGKEFTQTVNSIQMEHIKLAEAKKGQEIGMQVDQPVKEGDMVYIV